MGMLPSPIESLEPEESLHPQMDLLLEFRAGKMLLDGTRVHADPRKGLVRVIRSDDSLVHFQWVDTVVNAIEEDQIVLPEEATFEKVSQSSGRVYILKFKHDDRNFFFWMQGPRIEEDQQFCDDVQHLLNQPLYSDEEEEANPQGTSAASESREATEASARDVNMVGFPSESLPSSAGAVQMADLQRILHGLSEVPVPQAAAEEYFRDTGPSFTDIFKPEVVLPLLDSTSLKERLVPLLPEGVETPEALGDLMRSPQFQQQLDMFAHVLRSGQLDWAQFGIDPSNYNFTVSSFLEAIEDQTISTSESNSPPSIAPRDDNKPGNEHDKDGQKDDKRTAKDNDLMEGR
ncbi:unnamed protein product [Calypogeia fissa]